MDLISTIMYVNKIMIICGPHRFTKTNHVQIIQKMAIAKKAER